MAGAYHLATFDLPGALLRPPDGRDLAGAPFLPGVAEDLRRLANKVPIGLLAPGDPRAAARVAERLGVPVSLHLPEEGAGSDASLEDLLARVRKWVPVPPQRILHVSCSAEALRCAAARQLSCGYTGPEPPADLPLQHSAPDLGALVSQVLALPEPELPYDGALAAHFPVPYLQGVHAFNARAYYEAHEVWEDMWKAAGGAESGFYRGLIQMAVGTLHWERGNAPGAQLLYTEGRELLKRFVPSHQGLEVVAFLQAMEDYFDPLLAALADRRPAPPPATAEAPRIVLRA